ncbi:MAG TPA: hypothetical protein VH599_02870 [Ktedonobacterales bacterium]|jgi:hypothetical protein
MQAQVQVYPERYLEVQLLFARKVAEVARLSLAEAVLHNTAIYKILGIEGQFDAAQPAWQSYIQGLQGTRQDTAWAYQTYLTRYPNIPKFTDFPHWGCFAYDYYPERLAIRLHFSNQDTSSCGALSHERRSVRVAEMRAMFQYIRDAHPQARWVSGGSWLYNWDAYRRLFPPTFGQSARVDSPHLQFRALWGQFLRHTWQVNEEMAADFLQRVQRLRALEGIADCFPYQVLVTQGELQDFFAFYQV